MPLESRQFGPGEWQQFSTFLWERFGEGFGNADFVFRGEPQVYPTLHSPIDRIFANSGAGIDIRLEAEVFALNQFFRRGAVSLNAVEGEQLDAVSTRLIFLRHCGGPTRLVDWTESPWIGAYFATSGGLEGDARMLAFDRSALTRVVHAAHGDQTATIWNRLGDGRPMILNNQFVGRAAEWVVTLNHMGKGFPRLVAQQGLFTMASKPNLDHWATINRLIPDHCVAITLDRRLRSTVLRHLSRMGITAATMYPGADGVATSIGEHIRGYFAHPA